MMRDIFTCVLGCVAVVLLSGCYTTRTYVVNKERVDQDIPGQTDKTPVKTRKMVVFEVIEKEKAHPVLAEDTGAASSAAAAAPATAQSGFDLPKNDPFVDKASVAVVPPQSYMVEKDDTLQKISKKVYGSYSKWTVIYDANRDVIKDPNFLRSGVMLKIPVPVTGATENN